MTHAHGRSSAANAAVFAITPADTPFIHTFYDVCPWSHSGSKLLALKLPFQDRTPAPDDVAQICLVDLDSGTIDELASTRGWAMQTGAHQTWGADDQTVFFNDQQEGEPVAVRYDLQTGRSAYWPGGIYQIAPNGRFAISPSLAAIERAQPGYGMSVRSKHMPPLVAGPCADDGFWRLDLASGERSLFVSFAAMFAAIPDPSGLEQGAFHGFHVKFNRQGTRVLLVLRVLFNGGRHGGGHERRFIFTCSQNGGGLKLALPDTIWARGGHHPDWHPDGERILMNLKDHSNTLRFHEFRYDGTGLQVILPELLGSGHPSYSADGRWIVTDAYPNEPVCRDAFVPLRLIERTSGSETTVCWLWTLGAGHKVLRVDPHPVWHRSESQLCFTAAPQGVRQLFIAKLSI